MLELLHFLLIVLVLLPRKWDRSKITLSNRRAGALDIDSHKRLVLSGTPSSISLYITSSKYIIINIAIYHVFQAISINSKHGIYLLFGISFSHIQSNMTWRLSFEKICFYLFGIWTFHSLIVRMYVTIIQGVWLILIQEKVHTLYNFPMKPDYNFSITLILAYITKYYCKEKRQHPR